MFRVTREMNLVLFGNTDGDGAVFSCLVQKMSLIIYLTDMLETFILHNYVLSYILSLLCLY